VKFCGVESSLLCFRCRSLQWPILPKKGIPARPLTAAEAVDRFFCECEKIGEIVRPPQDCPDFSERISSRIGRIFSLLR
jgi:hypothetical protein